MQSQPGFLAKEKTSCAHGLSVVELSLRVDKLLTRYKAKQRSAHQRMHQQQHSILGQPLFLLLQTLRVMLLNLTWKMHMLMTLKMGVGHLALMTQMMMVT